MCDVSHAVDSTPWTTRACADYMGFTPKFIRGAVVAGVRVGRQRVKLEAETILLGGRCTYRIHLDKFIEFLTALGWHRLPVASLGSYSNN